MIITYQISFFPLVRPLWFHLRVHRHRLSNVVEFYISPIFGTFTHITERHHRRDSLSPSLSLSPRLQTIFSRAMGSHSTSLTKFSEKIKNPKKQITCHRHKLHTHCIPPPWFEGWLWRRWKARQPKTTVVFPPGARKGRIGRRCKGCGDRLEHESGEQHCRGATGIVSHALKNNTKGQGTDTHIHTNVFKRNEQRISSALNVHRIV